MSLDRMTLARARLALHKAVRDWLFDPNVTVIGFGYPKRANQFAKDELAICVHVRHKKRPGFELEAAVKRGMTGGTIPSSIDGFPTDVQEGIYRPHQWWSGAWWRHKTEPRAERVDPMRGGISIGNERNYDFGTLSTLVTDRNTGKSMCLSNWHVLVGGWGMRLGQSIYQPGRLDGGTRGDTIATLTRDAMSDNLDAAVATLTGDRRLINDQLGIGPVRGVSQAELGMEVIKSGRKTGVTYGRVTQIAVTAKLPYSGVTRIIRDVVFIDRRRPLEEVSGGGDSGALWLDNTTKQAVALHFAGSDRPEQALALDIQSVLDALDVDLVTQA